MRTSKTNPRKLESYLEQKEAYEGGLDPDVERLVDSLQQWQYEEALQPRPGYLNEVAQRLQEQRQSVHRPERAGMALTWLRRLLAGAVGTAAIIAFILFVAGLFEQPPVEPAASDRQTPLAAGRVTAMPSPTHVPITIQVNGETVVLIPGENISPEHYALAQDLAFRLSADWVLSDGLWEPIASDTPVDICEIDPNHPDCEEGPGGLMPTQTPLATLPAEPPASDASGMTDTCTVVPRPALLLGRNVGLDRQTLIVIDPPSGNHCTIGTEAYTAGALAVSGDTVYYPRRNRPGSGITVWQHPFDGEPAPLSFTDTLAVSTTWFGLAISPDGRHIVWTTFSDDVEGASDARYRSTVWLGNLQAGTATLLWQEDVPDTLPPTIEPLYISPEDNVVYFARRPYGIGGTGPFPAQYTSLHALSLDGGEPQPVFACESVNRACLNDVDFERRLMATVANEGGQPELRLVAFDGSLVARYAPPDTNYVAEPVFSPGGDMAFITANLERTEDGTAIFQSSAIHVLPTPYTGEPQTVLQETGTALELWGWFDNKHLITGGRSDGQWLALLTPDGERIAIPESGTAVPITVLPR